MHAVPQTVHTEERHNVLAVYNRTTYPAVLSTSLGHSVPSVCGFVSLVSAWLTVKTLPEGWTDGPADEALAALLEDLNNSS